MPQPKDPRRKSLLRKRSIILDRHKTSVTLEDPFWAALKEIAAAQGTTISQLITAIDSERHKRHHPNLSSAIRLFVLEYYRQQNERGPVP
jgi:predicted DNA-binding ribbon-helix-helix protein